MTLKAAQRHSVWLCPEPATATRLREEILTFSKRSGTGVFEPHVTLLGDLACAPQTTMDACRAHFGQMHAISAEVTGLTQTNAFFMSLFLDVHVDRKIFDTRSALGADLGLVADTPFRPHISLAYGLDPAALAKSEKRTLQERYSGLEFHLTSLAIVRSGRDLQISEWRTLAELRLAQV